jgi:hypothetical protein
MFAEIMQLSMKPSDFPLLILQHDLLVHPTGVINFIPQLLGEK